MKPRILASKLLLDHTVCYDVWHGVTSGRMVKNFQKRNA